MKLLIVKTSSLGDILHAFPVVQFLKEHFPESEIEWIVEAPFEELVKAHPLIDKVIVANTRAWRRRLFSFSTWKQIYFFRKAVRQKRYDIAFDLQGNLKSGLLLAQVKARHKVGFGWKTAPERINFFFTSHHYNPPKGRNIREDYLFVVKEHVGIQQESEEKKVVLTLSEIDKARVDFLLKSAEERFKILVCHGSFWRNKQLPFSSLVSFLKTLEKKRPTYFFFAWGSEQEKSEAQRLCAQFSQSEVVERFSLPLLQYLMSRVEYVVAMDSLPLHLCATTHTPSFSFFGPSSALKYQPKGSEHQSIQGECPYGIVFEKRCPKLRTCPTGACLKNLDLTGSLDSKKLY